MGEFVWSLQKKTLFILISYNIRISPGAKIWNGNLRDLHNLPIEWYNDLWNPMVKFVCEVGGVSTIRPHALS